MTKSFSSGSYWPCFDRKQGVNRFKILIMMKLTGMMLFSALLTHASTFSQTVTLKSKSLALAEALKVVENQSGYIFFYKSEDIKGVKTGDVDIQNAHIQKALNVLLGGLPLRYKIEGKTVAIVKKATGQGRTARTFVQEEAVAVQADVTGKVVDGDGTPIVGASVHIKGTTRGTSSGPDGTFNISAARNETLVVSSIGFQATEIVLEEQFALGNIVLSAAANELDELVVVGYGTQRKASLTSAITTVKAEELERIAPSNLSNTLAGRAPGVTVTNTSGMSGASSSVRIRGSFAEPLYVIDGIVRDKASFDALEAGEVDQITFLKDGAAAAVYGTRAGNGVVVVTTRKGASQKPMFNLQSNYTFMAPTQTLLADLTTATDELIYQNRVSQFIWERGDQATPWVAPNGDEEFEYFRDKSYNANDIIWRNPFSHRQSISVNGGNDKITYYNLISYRGEQGSYQSLDHHKFNLRSNVSARISDAFTIDLNLSANQQNSKKFYWPFNTSANDDDFDVSDFYRVTFNWPKLYPFYVDADGNPTNDTDAFPLQAPVGTWSLWNVIDQVNGDRYINRKIRQVNPILSLNLKLDKVLDGLSTRFVGSYVAEDYLRKRYMTFQKNYSFASANPTGNRFIPAAPDESRVNIFNFSQTRPFMDYTMERKWEYQMNWFLNYMKTFNNNHTVDAMLALEQFESGLTNVEARAEDPLTDYDQMFLYPTDRNFRNANGMEALEARQAAIGRVNYNYANKYIAEFSFRYDGTTLFDSDKRWGFFPSVSAAWRLSEEEFFANVRNTVNDLRLRASYGSTGNYLDENGIPINQFTFRENYSTVTINPETGVQTPVPGSVFGNTYYNGLRYMTAPNPNVTWTVSKSYNVGLDFGFLNNRLTGNLDFFLRKESDILATRVMAVPDNYGRELAKENYAARSYRGGELTVAWSDRVNEVQYGITANLGFATNRWDVIDELASFGPGGNQHFRTRIGRPHEPIFGFQALDLVRTQEQLDQLNADGYTIFGRTPYLGMVMIEDIRGANFAEGADGKIDENDLQLLSLNKDPRFNYGLGLNGSWKGLSVSALFQGVFRYDRMISIQEGHGIRQHGGNARPYYPIWTDDVWTYENPNAKYPRPVGSNWLESGGSYTFENQVLSSSYWMRSGAYLRLRDLNVSYRLPQTLASRFKLDNVSVFANGTNLFVISPMTAFHDPEQKNYDSYPVMRTFSLGLDVKF